MIASTGSRLRLLHLVNTVRATNTHYHEHCLPVRHERDLTICTFRDAELRPPPEISLFQGGGTLRGYWRALGAALDRARPDVIHAHSPQTAALFMARALIARRGDMARAVYTVHNCYQNYRARNRLLLVPIFAAFPSIALCSRAVLESLPPALRWLARGKVTVVPNSVDVEPIDRVLRDEVPGRSHDVFTIVSVGQLIARKDPFTVMAAVDGGTPGDASLVYVGEGDLRSSLVRESTRRGIRERVELTGLLDRDDVYRRLSAADVYVSASTGEGLPVAVLEAMACGLPVVLSDIEPHREIARGVDFVPLFRPRDVASLARELQRYSEMSPEDRRLIGKRCREHVEEWFGVRAMHRAYKRIYSNLVARPRRRRRRRARTKEHG